MSKINTNVIRVDDHEIEIHVTQYKDYIEVLGFQHENPNLSVFNWGYKESEKEAHDLFQQLTEDHEIIQATVAHLLSEQEDEDDEAIWS